MTLTVERMLALLLINIAFSGIVLADQPCSESIPDVNLETCLEDIREAAEDKSLFWFGTDYNTRCGFDRYSMDCFSMIQTVNNSLVDLTFNHLGGSFNRDLIDRFVEVTFTSEAGTLSGCDHTEEREARTFSLNPLSGDIYSPWETRDSPVITWDANDDEQYTVVCYDVAYKFLHALYVNVPGNDIDKGEVIKQYSGPLNNRDVPTPYSFMVFKQNQSNIQVSNVRDPITMQFSPADLQENYDLHGPIAMNWMVIGFDAYSVNVMASRGISQNCGGLVKLELRDDPAHQRPWFPSFTMHDLAVYMNIKITTEPVEYKACCDLENYSGGTINLDPLDSTTILNAVEVRSEGGSTLDITMEMNKVYPNKTADFIGKHYTLLAVDPDVPNPGAGTPEKPIAHMLLVNIMGSDITTGNTIIPYGGPKPPDGPHYYYFLLYEQGETMETNTSYYLDYTKEGSNRLLFDMDAFLTNETLTLVGATWMRATTDSWVRKSHLDQGRPREDVCGQVSCETSGGSQAEMKFLPICLALVMAFSLFFNTM